MRVAVDATPLLREPTGVGHFTAALLDGLARHPEVDVTAFPVSVRGRGRLAAVAPPGVRTVAPPLPARLLRRLWAQRGWPRVDPLIGRHDIVHGPNFVVPPSAAVRVVTVHDLTALHRPELCDDDTVRYPDHIRRAAADGAWIHAVSDAVRDDIVASLGVDHRRVVSVPNGFTPVHGDAAAGRRLAGTDRYVLAVGTVEPRKDLPSLLRAVDTLATAHPDLVLVHAGGDGWGMEAFSATLGAMDHPGRVRRLGRTADADLADLYAGARLVAYPSVLEGFGLPVLEAMSAGAPVVSTQVPAIVEVAGDAAMLVPVGDVDALAAAIEGLWTDEELRSTLVQRGHERCGHYDWDRCVASIVELYRRALDGR